MAPRSSIDRTLISRATPLALANTSRRHRILRRRDLLRAAAWQLIFMIRGVEGDAVRRAAEDGAIGSTCEIVDGVYTGRGLRPCYGEFKARALEELAVREKIDLAASTAYSDSHTDLAFLEAVGRPIAADSRLRRIAIDRGWRVLSFDKLPSARRRGHAWRKAISGIAGLARVA